MRLAVAILAAAFFTNASAQSNSVLYPSPLGVVLSAGKFLYNYDHERQHLVTVKSYGKDETEARKQGFQLAIEHVVGQLILSDREVVDNQVVRNEIIQYSSGYVSKYEVKSKETIGRDVVLVIDVWVKQSKIAQRLVNHSTDKSRIDGKNIKARLESVNNQTANGDRVLNAVLNDYPLRAFSIQTKNITIDSSRAVTMTIPVVIRWNPEYLQSLGEALVKTNEGVLYSDRKHGYRLAVRTGGWIPKTYDVWTADYKRYTMFNSTFSDIAVKVEVFDEFNNPVLTRCVSFNHEMTKFINNQIVIDGSAKVQQDVDLLIEESMIESMHRLVVTAVRQCNVVMAKR